MMRTERFSLCPSSRSARTVMPTEVAVSAVAMNRAALDSQPKSRPSSRPPMNGRAAPSTATLMAAARVSRSSSMCVSSPAMKSSMITPSSAKVSRISPEWTQVEQLGAEDGAGEQFADDHGQLEALEEVARAGAPR